MSERDDDYLWSGEGPASDDLVKLEKLLGGEKLREPLRARRRPVVAAMVVALLAAAAALAIGRHAVPPLSWIGTVLPGVAGDELTGGVIELEVVDPAPPAGWQKAVEARMAEIGARSVRIEGRRASIDFADDVPRELGTGDAQQGTLEFKEVVESSDLMKALYARVEGGDPKAAELGVTAETDVWDHDESGTRHSDWYLTADSEQALRQYLESAARDAELAPASGFEIRFERMEPPDRPVRWRTYYLASRAWLSNRDVADAYVYWNDQTRRPEVLVEFDRDGAERFADLTERLAGHKLAILLNGQVSSAPVVQVRIAGGRCSVTMGGSNYEKVQYDAQHLVNVLKAGRFPLPVAMRQVSVTMRADSLSGAQIQSARVALSVLFGLLVFAAVWIAERRSPRLDPEVSPVRGRPRRRSVPWVRLLISAAGVGLALAAQRIPLSSDPGFESLGLHLPVFALGIMPALSAYLLVELAALIVPRWRRLRSGGPSDRARLGAATAVVTVVLALLQAWFIADFLLSVAPFANLSRWLMVFSLAGAAVVMALLALFIDKYGLGNGFAVLILAGLGAQAYELVPFMKSGEASWPISLSLFSAIAATAIATAWILRKRLRSASPASAMRLPTAGVVPLATLPALLTLLVLVWPELAGRLGLWWSENVSQPTSGLLVELGVLIAATAALSWLFSRPSRLGPATTSDTGRTHLRGFALATAVSIGYLAFIALVQRWLVDTIALSMIGVVYATAIVMDLVTEWRAFRRRDDLVPVWPLHQVQQVDLVTGALAKNEIDVHTRGLYLRLLLHFFGPFVPVLIYVPAAQAEEARAIIRAQIEPK